MLGGAGAVGGRGVGKPVSWSRAGTLGAFVAVLVIALSALPAAAAPVVGTEHAVADHVVEPAPQSQSESASAFDGTNFLVVWSDDRGASGSILRGARISPSGEVLDRVGFTVANLDGDATDPAVAFDGSVYLVVWQQRTKKPDEWSKTVIRSIRVDPSGTVLGTPRGLSGVMRGTDAPPAVAFDGAAWMVVWSGPRSGAARDVLDRRVLPSGAPTGLVSTVSAAADGGGGWDPQIARRGSGSFVVFRHYGSVGDTIVGARLDASGAVVDRPAIAIASDEAQHARTHPSVAASQSSLLVVWEEVTGAFARRIFGTPVSFSGTVADPGGHPLVDSGIRSAPRVASDGSGWLVAFESKLGGVERDLDAVRVGADGAAIGGVIDVASGPGWRSDRAVSFGGGRYLVTGDGPVHDTDVLATRVSPAGAVLDRPPLVLSQAPNDQHHPAVAFDGTNHLVVWNNNGSDPGQIFGSRVGSGGSHLDGRGFLIGSGDAVGSPAVSFDGLNYVVAWRAIDLDGGPTQLLAARVSRNGTVLDPTPLVLGSSYPDIVDGVAVSSDPATHTSLVAYTALASSAPLLRKRAVRISGAGQVLDATPIPVTPDGGSTGGLDLAFNGTDFLVAWTEAGTDGQARVTRVTTSGVVRDPGGIQITSGAGTHSPVRLASAGSTTLVVWSNRGDGTPALWSARFSSAGDVVGSPRKVIDTPRPLFSVAGRNNFLVVAQTSADRLTAVPVGTGGAVGSPVPVTSAKGLAAVDAAPSTGAGYRIVYERSIGNLATGSFIRSLAL
jgi:hypothetical protein